MPEVMSPERWERIKSLFALALEMEPEDRSDFVASAAGDDSELRRELERLLDSDESATQFLEEPALRAPTILLASRATFETGDLLAGRFRIVRLIGRGGMGEVYEAEDRAIPNTRIALKTIRADAAGSPDHVLRFREEVRLARSITHRGVCRIHELFETLVPG